MSKNKSPAFQFYPSDYLADANVAAMTLEAEGAYIRLLCYCWREGWIPDPFAPPSPPPTAAGKRGASQASPSKESRNGQSADWRMLAGLCRCTPRKMEVLWPMLAPCFKSHGRGRLYHERLRREKRKQVAYRKAKQEAGSRGGKAKAAKQLASTAKNLPVAKASSSSSSAVSVLPFATTKDPENSIVAPTGTTAAKAERRIQNAQIQAAYEIHCAARVRFFEAENGQPPGHLPDLSARVKKAIRESIKQHGFDKTWQAGIGVFYSDWHAGRDERTNGKRYLSLPLVWSINGQRDNPETFAELYHERGGMTDTMRETVANIMGAHGVA